VLSLPVIGFLLSRKPVFLLPIQARQSFASCVEMIKFFEQMRLVTGFASTNRSAEICPMVDTADFCCKI